MSEPLLQKVSVLNNDLKNRISALTGACQQNGDDGVPYPLEEEDCFHYLLWCSEPEDETPAPTGALAILPLSDNSAECIAYVHPGHRRKGYFSQLLLPEASEDFAGLEFIFPVRNENADVISVLKAIGAEYDRTELKMELTLKTSSAPEGGLCCRNFSDTSDFSDTGICPSGTESLNDIPDIYLYPPDVENPPGSCRLERISSDAVCLYEVEVEPEYRNHGVGMTMIESLAGGLKKFGITRILVHVSAANLPAVSVYKKTGFRITETLSYYLF